MRMLTVPLLSFLFFVGPSFGGCPSVSPKKAEEKATMIFVANVMKVEKTPGGGQKVNFDILFYWKKGKVSRDMTLIFNKTSCHRFEKAQTLLVYCDGKGGLSGVLDIFDPRFEKNHKYLRQQFGDEISLPYL